MQLVIETRCPQEIGYSILKGWGKLGAYGIWKVYFDFLGPFPRWKRGYTVVLVISDAFKKWIECIPLPGQMPETTARAAVNQFFVRLGFPLILITAQGTNFESELFRLMCDMLQIMKKRTVPYKPSANGQVETKNNLILNTVKEQNPN